jgi:glycosyltransferase involved in cell wall biosynthesis
MDTTGDVPAPKCSVLMGVYNAERFVGQAVESILTQTFADFEFIIINDGSTDRSLDVLRSFENQDKRIVLITRENRGIGATRNELLHKARGAYVATMDADDVSIGNRLELQVAFLDSHLDVVCLGGNYELIDEAGRHLIDLDRQPLTDDEIQRQHLRGETSINNPTVMMRREAVLTVGGYDEELAPAEDLDLYLKLGEIGKLANLPEIVLRYRELGTSASATAHDAQLERMRIGTERAWKRRGIVDGVFAAKPWRPMTRSQCLERWLKFGWWGFAQGNPEHTRAYGWKAVALCPWSPRAWTLLIVGYFKMPQNRRS